MSLVAPGEGARHPHDVAAVVARALAGAEGAGAPLTASVSPRDVAWALKDLCVGAWARDPGQARRAATALARLAADHAHAGTPAGADEIDALAQWAAGIVHVTSGRMADAAACFDGAAATFRHLGAPRHAAQAMVPKIMALSMLGRHTDAIDCARRAQRELAALGDTHAAGKVSLNLGSLHLRRDEYADAARHYREAAVLFARVGAHENSIMADIGSADAQAAQGDFDEALRLYARARMRATRRSFPVLNALVDESAALIDLARGNYGAALNGLERARAQYEALAMPQHRAIAEKQLADAYLEVRLLPEALALFDRAVVEFHALAMPDERGWTLVQRSRAQARLAMRTEAAASLVDAADVFAAAGNRVGGATVALARAELASLNGDFHQALAHADRAREVFAAADRPDGAARADAVCAGALLAAGDAPRSRAAFGAARQHAAALGLHSLKVQCLTGWGLAARAMGDHEAAEAAFAEAVALFESERRALPADDLRSAFLADHLCAYEELLRIALARHAADPSPAHAAEVLRRLDRFRAGALAERIARDDVAADEGATRALRARLDWLYRRVRRKRDLGEATSALTAEMQATERELLERERRRRLVSPANDRDAERRPDAAFDIDELQGVLGYREALVEYGVQDDELFACVVTGRAVTVFRRLARWHDTCAELRGVRFQLDTLRHGVAPVRAHMDRLRARADARLARLHTMLWAPFASALAHCDRVLVVPHGQLGALPFAALRDGGAYLACRHALAQAPSGRLALHGLRRQVERPSRAVAIGDSERLAHAASEARFVAGLFADGVALVGADATVDALPAYAVGADVLHFACHATFRTDSPRFSALHLRDGTLTAEAAERVRTDAGIVALSACETGLAQEARGDEMVGLVRAFLIAGAARVLASLWSVDDAAARDFMAGFYGELARGAAPADALARTEVAMMKDRPHPFHWAAFALYGGF